MDILKALRELYLEKKRLDVAIAALEGRVRATKTGSGAGASKGRRGRKSMSAAERLEVSKRMTLYWKARRAGPNASSAQPSGDEQATAASQS